MAKTISTPLKRRQFTDEFRRDAVQMMLDGLSASAVAERLGLADPTLLYVWKQKLVTQSGPVADTLDAAGAAPRSRVAPRRTRAGHLKKSVGHFRPPRVSDVYAAVEAIARDTRFALAAGLRRARGLSLGLLRLAPRRAVATRAGDDAVDRSRDGDLLAAQASLRRPADRGGVGRSRRRVQCQASRESAEKPGPASDSAEVVRAEDHRQPATASATRPNLVLDAPEPRGVDQLWVGDITYLPIRRGGFVYLAGLMDRFSRDIVGWHVAATMTEPLVLAALRAGAACAAAEAGPGASHRPRRPVCRPRLSGRAAASGPGAEHEPRRQLLRQCVHGKLLGNIQDRNGNRRIRQRGARAARGARSM